MSVSILSDEHGAVMYCNTTMWAFGPVFNTVQDAQEFKYWVDKDPRDYSNSELESLYSEWLRTRGLPFDSDDEREAFVSWLGKDISDYDLDALDNIHSEWKLTVWGDE